MDPAARQDGGVLVMLDVRSLHVSFGQREILSDITFTVEPGEVVALIGPNGTGKSTLIRAISGVLSPTGGTIAFGGTELTRLSPQARARVVAVVPQARQLGGAFTVEQTVTMGRTAYMDWLGTVSEKDSQVVQQALHDTCMIHLAERRIATLSGGEQQRVLFARALAQTPQLLLLDEPTNHLDLQHQATILSLARIQAEKDSLAVLMALHDLNLVSLYADRVILLENGRIAAQGTPENVLTEEQINRVYQTQIEVVKVAEYEIPIILPYRGGKNHDQNGRT
jgi:iron complex transport system ATP-binding protein